MGLGLAEVKRVEMRSSGVKEILRSQNIQTYMSSLGSQIAGKAKNATGIDYVVTAQPGRNRAHVRISTTRWVDYLKEMQAQALLKATPAAKVMPVSKQGIDAYRNAKATKKALTNAKRRRTRAVKKMAGIKGSAQALRTGLEVRQAQRAHRRALKAHQKTRKGS